MRDAVGPLYSLQRLSVLRLFVDEESVRRLPAAFQEDGVLASDNRPSVSPQPRHRNWFLQYCSLVCCFFALFFPSLCVRLTPQLRELELVHKRFREEGLVVLGVPSNDFGGQEVKGAEGRRSYLCLSRSYFPAVGI